MNACPEFPPGLWRRIRLSPESGAITAALEDDVHHMRVRIEHAGGRITGFVPETLRAPWTACPGAPAHLLAAVSGKALDEVAALDPLEHCTHLFDIAVLAAAHAGDTRPVQFDIRVADRVEGRTTAVLMRDGREALCWRLDGTLITGPDAFAGRDLRQLSRWKHDFPAETAEQATLMRRAVFVSGARQFEPVPGQTAAQVSEQRLGACYNFRLPQAGTSVRRDNWRHDFSTGSDEPLGTTRITPPPWQRLRAGRW